MNAQISEFSMTSGYVQGVVTSEIFRNIPGIVDGAFVEINLKP